MAVNEVGRLPGENVGEVLRRVDLLEAVKDGIRIGTANGLAVWRPGLDSLDAGVNVD